MQAITMKDIHSIKQKSFLVKIMINNIFSLYKKNILYIVYFVPKLKFRQLYLFVKLRVVF